MVKVKICGITNLDDAIYACDCGADALGFNFYERSLRYISPRKARKIIDQLPAFVQTVGIFVEDTAPEINDICEETGITLAQAHDESMRVKDLLQIKPRVMKTFRVGPDFKLPDVKWYFERTGINTFLFDAFHEKMQGGTGKQIKAEQAKQIVNGVSKYASAVIAGGLNEKNVAGIVKAVRPYGIDVASGIESSIGKKDHRKMKHFIERAKTS